MRSLWYVEGEGDVPEAASSAVGGGLGPGGLRRPGVRDAAAGPGGARSVWAVGMSAAHTGADFPARLLGAGVAPGDLGRAGFSVPPCALVGGSGGHGPGPGRAGCLDRARGSRL